jgi:hypothetical protein
LLTVAGPKTVDRGGGICYNRDKEIVAMSEL